MRHALREEDTIARLGGDEFVIVLADLPATTAGTDLLPRLLAAIAAPMTLQGITIETTASLGVTFHPRSVGTDLDAAADRLLQEADQAMYQAKGAGRNRYHVFDGAISRGLRRPAGWRALGD